MGESGYPVRVRWLLALLSSKFRRLTQRRRQINNNDGHKLARSLKARAPARLFSCFSDTCRTGPTDGTPGDRTNEPAEEGEQETNVFEDLLHRRLPHRSVDRLCQPPISFSLPRWFTRKSRHNTCCFFFWILARSTKYNCSHTHSRTRWTHRRRSSQPSPPDIPRPRPSWKASRVSFTVKAALVAAETCR